MPKARDSQSERQQLAEGMGQNIGVERHVLRHMEPLTKVHDYCSS